MRSILSAAPLYLVDLLFYFEGFEVVEFGFVRLEFCMELILACLFLQNVSSFPGKTSRLRRSVAILASTYCLVPLKKHNSPSFVTSCQIIARVVEFDCRYYIGCKGYVVSTRPNS